MLIKRILYIINNIKIIDSEIDQVMDGWRLKDCQELIEIFYV